MAFMSFALHLQVELEQFEYLAKVIIVMIMAYENPKFNSSENSNIT